MIEIHRTPEAVSDELGSLSFQHTAEVTIAHDRLALVAAGKVPTEERDAYITATLAALQGAVAKHERLRQLTGELAYVVMQPAAEPSPEPRDEADWWK